MNDDCQVSDYEVESVVRLIQTSDAFSLSAIKIVDCVDLSDAQLEALRDLIVAIRKM